MGINFVTSSSSGVLFGTNNDVLGLNSAATISLWIYPRTAGVGNAGRIISRETTSTTQGVIFVTGTNSTLRFVITGGTTMDLRASDNSITFNVWQHVVFTYDGTSTAANQHFYINGVEPTYQVSNNGATNNDNSTSETRIGNNDVLTRAFDGYISEVAIWNSVLPLSDIKKLAQARVKYFPLQISPSNLKRYWPIDNFTDSVAMAGSGTVIDRNTFNINGVPTFASGGASPTALAEQVLSYQ